MDPDFSDIPLGGWTGTILEVDQEARPKSYLIQWNQDTLDQMHSVYRKRCQRDDLEIECMWLGEDELELDTGKPVKIEQPLNLITRSLSKDKPEDRIRAIFGLTSDDPLPLVTEDNHCHYHRYLATHLSFPFQAKYSEETGPFEDEQVLFTVTGLLDFAECNDDEGIQCEATEDGEEAELPLADLESTINIHNRQLIEDYAYWFYNFSPEDSDIETNGAMTSFSQMQIVHEPITLDKRTFIQGILFFGLVGAISGITLGSVLAAMATVQIGAIAGAVVLGLLGLFIGTRFWTVPGVVIPKTHLAIFGGVIGTVGGMILGALIGSILGAIVGILIGMVIGGLVGSWFLNGRVRWMGLVLGAVVGAISQAFYFDQDKAREGAIYGAIIGAITGIVIFLAMLGLMAWLERLRNRL